MTQLLFLPAYPPCALFFARSLELKLEPDPLVSARDLDASAAYRAQV